MHAFKAGEHCVPYSVGALSWVYTHTKLVFLLEERSHTSAEYNKTVARKLIRLELMSL